MTETLANQIQYIASYAQTWGLLIIFVFMAIESTVVPFPSEVVMIPAGFLAYRGELTTSNFAIDMVLITLAGAFGSLAGASINYFVSQKLGRPILYKYGKYFFMPEKTLKRSEEIFNAYGGITTFVCRFIPVVRHLISIPAGLAEMNFKSFAWMTTLGAGCWAAILSVIGAYLGKISGKDASYIQIVEQGKEIISKHSVTFIIILALITAIYFFVHHLVMHKKIESK